MDARKRKKSFSRVAFGAPSRFRTRVEAAVRSIPKGETRTYGEVATVVGSPGAARAVGSVMRTNKDKSVPCHRVVAQSGLGGYNGLQGEKEALLRKEGALT